MSYLLQLIPHPKSPLCKPFDLYRGIVLHHGFICLILRDCFQVLSWVFVQHQVGIGSGIVVEQIIQFGAFVHVVGEGTLHLLAVDGHDRAVGQA